MIAHVIHDDTGLPDDASRLLAVSPGGMAQVSARFWLSDPGRSAVRCRVAGRRAGVARDPRLPRADEH